MIAYDEAATLNKITFSKSVAVCFRNWL